YADRKNSLGLDLADQPTLQRLAAQAQADRAAAPRDAVEDTSPQELDFSIARAADSFESWSAAPAEERAALLEHAADALEEHKTELVSLIVREGGRTYSDSVAEVREAADFCRYYAAQARTHFSNPDLLSGPAGERNELRLHGRGVFACISPWNFPLAIFTGQI